MAAQEFRVTEVLDLADRLVKEGHPEEETINRRKEVCCLYSLNKLYSFII